jgi:protein subunit release factor A
MKEKIILEIRAGEGGTDSKMFAKDMARMYESYASKMGFSVD